MSHSPDQLNTQILQLVATIRQMDQKIYRMSQCSSWEQMRPIFNELHAGTERRMQDESRRIQMLLIPEIREAYINDAAQVTSTIPAPRQLEGPKHAGDAGLSIQQRKDTDRNRS